jgi:hypothetical protein
VGKRRRCAPSPCSSALLTLRGLTAAQMTPGRDLLPSR